MSWLQNSIHIKNPPITEQMHDMSEIKNDFLQ